MPWDPDEGVLLIMALLPVASLVVRTISWAQEARQREAEESGGRSPWGRDQEEEDSLDQSARQAARASSATWNPHDHNVGRGWRQHGREGGPQDQNFTQSA